MHGSWLLLKYIILMVTDLSLSTDHFQKFIQKNHLISYCHAKFGRSMKPLEKAMNYKKT